MGLLLRAVAMMLLLPGTGAFLVPWLIRRWGHGRFEAGDAQWAGVAPLAAGLAGLLWCIADFARRGRGTVAFHDPPREMVRCGLYRYVRNPMYVACLVCLAGQVFLYETWFIALWGVALFGIFNLLVLLHEEPSLRRRFGDAYGRYLEEVPRWMPRAPRRGGEPIDVAPAPADVRAASRP